MLAYVACALVEDVGAGLVDLAVVAEGRFVGKEPRPEFSCWGVVEYGTCGSCSDGILREPPKKGAPSTSRGTWQLSTIEEIVTAIRWVPLSVHSRLDIHLIEPWPELFDNEKRCADWVQTHSRTGCGGHRCAPRNSCCRPGDV